MGVILSDMTMRMINKKYLAILASAGLLAVISCEKTEVTVKGGDEILFSAETEGCENVDTKATYSGVNYSGSGKTYEKIYWSVGDVIKIYCKNGSTQEIEASGVTSDPAKYQADYRVSEVNSDNTKAKIVLNSSTTPIGLRWNDDETVTHNFYAVYPSFQAADKQITRAYNNGINGKSIYCNLAWYQNTLSGALTNDGNGNYTLAPDMKWMLMHGHASYTRSNFPADGNVFISFQPLTTAIQFTITNSVAANLVIKKLSLISGSQICGTFNIDDVTNTDGGFPVATHTTGVVHNDVHLEFESPYVTIAKDKKFTFTFFLSPVAEVNDLKFRITRSDGSVMTTRIGYTDGTYCTFPRCKKSFVKGIMTPEGVQWTIDYAPTMTKWEGDGGETLTLK